MRYTIIVDPAVGDPFLVYEGDLLPGEVGSMITYVELLMARRPPGWSLHIHRLPDKADAPSVG